MAEEACHTFASTTQVGLTQVLGLMKITGLVVLSIIFGLWIRARYLRFVAPARAAESSRETQMRQALSKSDSFVGHPAQLLFDAMGPETSSSSGDFGLISYSWQANGLCIYADVKNSICQSFKRHDRGMCS